MGCSDSSEICSADECSRSADICPRTNQTVVEHHALEQTDGAVQKRESLMKKHVQLNSPLQYRHGLYTSAIFWGDSFCHIFISTAGVFGRTSKMYTQKNPIRKSSKKQKPHNRGNFSRKRALSFPLSKNENIEIAFERRCSFPSILADIREKEYLYEENIRASMSAEPEPTAPVMTKPVTPIRPLD
jgi:hypothetical protein